MDTNPSESVLTEFDFWAQEIWPPVYGLSPWPTHMDYPKMDHTTELKTLGLGNQVDQVSGQFSQYNNPYGSWFTQFRNPYH